MSVGITKLQVLSLIDSLRADGQDCCVVTVVRTADATSAKAGAKAVVTVDGKLHGFVGGSCVQAAVCRAAADAIATQHLRLTRVKPKQARAEGTKAPQAAVTDVDIDGVEVHGSSCPSGGTVDLFLEPLHQQMRLVVCGDSPVAAALARLGRSMGYRLILASRRDGELWMPEVDERIAGFDLQALKVRPTDAVVVATQGRHDRQALASALGTPAFYVGMVGSRRKLGILLEALAADFPPERLASVRGPAGLDIGAIEPEEIALSILGEIVQERRRVVRHATPVGSS